jgi:hypothetical protein
VVVCILLVLQGYNRHFTCLPSGVTLNPLTVGMVLQTFKTWLFDIDTY